MQHSLKNGFTLVELLVAISIIGVLTSIITANFSSARGAARDQQRKTDLKDLQLAIERYRSDNGRYPEACDNATTWKGLVNGTFACSTGGYINGLTPDYIDELPVDPRADSYGASSNAGYLYRVDAAGDNFKLLAYTTVEEDLITAYTDEFARCPQDMNLTHCDDTPPSTTYAVYSSGFADE